MTFKFSKSAPFGTAPVGFLTLEERLVEADTRAAYFQNACEELLQVNKHLEERIGLTGRSLHIWTVKRTNRDQDFEFQSQNTKPHWNFRKQSSLWVYPR